MAKGQGGVRGNQAGGNGSVANQIKGRFESRGIDPKGIDNVVVNNAGTAYVKINAKAGDLYKSVPTSVVGASEMNVESWGIKGVKNIALYKDKTDNTGDVAANTRDITRQIRMGKARKNLDKRIRKGARTVQYI